MLTLESYIIHLTRCYIHKTFHKSYHLLFKSLLIFLSKCLKVIINCKKYVLLRLWCLVILFVCIKINNTTLYNKQYDSQSFNYIYCVTFTTKISLKRFNLCWKSFCNLNEQFMFL